MSYLRPRGSKHLRNLGYSSPANHTFCLPLLHTIMSEYIYITPGEPYFFGMEQHSFNGSEQAA